MASLSKLRQKRHDRLADRKRHKALYLKTHKRGFALAAARDGRAARKLRKLIAKAIHGTFKGVQLKSTALGAPHWGGGADIMGQFVAPFMAKHYGLPKGSGKRTPQHNAEIGGSPTSDHLTTRTNTFARDFPTFSGEPAARALAQEIGWTSWSANSYDTFDLRLGDHVFRFQILWGAGIDHGDHVHVGIELVS